MGVAIALDSQLLHGTGTAGMLLHKSPAYLPRPDLAPPVAVGTDKALDAIAHQIAAIEAAEQLPGWTASSSTVRTG